MKPRITLITLGVDDLQRAVRFYRDGAWRYVTEVQDAGKPADVTGYR